VGRHQNEWLKWVWVPVSYTQPETKRTNVVVTKVMHHILKIFMISLDKFYKLP